jgi:hypothetical protein
MKQWIPAFGAMLAALTATACVNTEEVIKACGDKTLEELKTQDTFTDECKSALRKLLPSNHSDVKGTWIALGSDPLKAVYLSGTTPDGGVLPLPRPTELTVTAVTPTGDSLLDTARFAVKSIRNSATGKLAISTSIDYSGSMSGQDILDATEIYRDLFSTFKVTGVPFESNIYRFSANVTQVSDYSTNPDTLKNRVRVDNTYPRASTSLYDAIGTAIVSLGDRTAPAKILFVMTDGYENTSRTYKTPAALYALARQHKVRVFMLGSFYADDTFLKEMARQTGGVYTYSKSVLELKSDALKLDTLVRGAIALEFRNLPTATDSIRVKYNGKTVVLDL